MKENEDTLYRYDSVYDLFCPIDEKTEEVNRLFRLAFGSANLKEREGE